MKKFVFILTAIMMSLSITLFAACGSDDAGAGGDESGTEVNLGNVLIVYFSATGNTEKIAGYIEDITGGTTFELVPQIPYSAADLRYGDSGSRVYKEYHDQSLRNVELVNAVPDNWETYETVFIGYPIWWGIAAWPVNGFIEANDFTGKAVVTFCTSASSPIGNSDTQLKNMAGAGDWKAGKRFSSSSAKSDVANWIESLNINFSSDETVGSP